MSIFEHVSPQCDITNLFNVIKFHTIHAQMHSVCPLSVLNII
jgi:hypothetical protein